MGATSVATVGLTLLFAFLSQRRSDRLRALEKQLRRTFEEFTLLYLAEERYVEKYCELSSNNKKQFKIECRQEITSVHGGKIQLTPEKIKGLTKDLDLD